MTIKEQAKFVYDCMEQFHKVVDWQVGHHYVLHFPSPLKFIMLGNETQIVLQLLREQIGQHCHKMNHPAYCFTTYRCRADKTAYIRVALLALEAPHETIRHIMAMYGTPGPFTIKP